MNYEVWTANSVELRIIEAAETLMMTPNVNVGGSGSSWPEHIPQYPRAMTYRPRPSPGALSRMTETWAWINAHPVEHERKLLYSWAWTKARKGRFLSHFAAREGINSKTLRRLVLRVCQRIADNLNQKLTPCRTMDVDQVSEIEPETASETVTPPNRATHWRDPSAKPFHLPQSEEHRRAIRRMQKRNAARKRD